MAITDSIIFSPDILKRLLPNVYHTKDTEGYDSVLKDIIAEIYEYTKGEHDEYLPSLAKFADRIYFQLLKDNTDSMPFRDYIADLIDKILAQEKYPIADNKNLTYLLSAIKHIINQHNSYLDYIIRYTQQCQVKLKDDSLDPINSFVIFTDSVVQGYITDLLNATEHISTADFQLQRATHNLLCQYTYELIQPYTENKDFVENLVAVQNMRLFRDRDRTIIIIGDSIACLNIIQLCWLYIQLMRELLSIDTPDSTIFEQLSAIVNEFLKTLDLSLLTRLKDLLDNIPDFDSNKIAGIVSTAQSVSKSYLYRVAIDRYMNELNKIQAMIDRFTSYLQYLLNHPIYQKIYNAINEYLDLLPSLLEKLNGLLASQQLNQLIADINLLIDAINKTQETLNKMLCALRLLTCILSGFIYFNKSVLNPLKDQAIRLFNDAKENLDAVCDFLSKELDKINKIARTLIMTTAQAKLYMRSYESSVAIGQTADPNFNVLFKASVDNAIGNGDIVDLQALKDKIKERAKEIGDMLAPSESQATNCPPFPPPNLAIRKPNLSLTGSLSKLNKLDLNVRC